MTEKQTNKTHELRSKLDKALSALCWKEILFLLIGILIGFFQKLNCQMLCKASSNRRDWVLWGLFGLGQRGEMHIDQGYNFKLHILYCKNIFYLMDYLEASCGTCFSTWYIISVFFCF